MLLFLELFKCHACEGSCGSQAGSLGQSKKRRKKRSGHFPSRLRGTQRWPRRRVGGRCKESIFSACAHINEKLRKKRKMKDAQKRFQKNRGTGQKNPQKRLQGKARHGCCTYLSNIEVYQRARASGAREKRKKFRLKEVTKQGFGSRGPESRLKGLKG